MAHTEPVRELTNAQAAVLYTIAATGWSYELPDELMELGLCEPHPKAPGYRLTTKGMFVLSLHGA